MVINFSVELRTMSKTLKRLLRKRVVSIDTFLDPDFYCPEMRSYELFYLPDNLRIPEAAEEPEVTFMGTDTEIEPVGVRFNDSGSAVSRKLGKPFLIVKNDRNLPNHRIYLYKRRIGNYKTTTQVHLMNNRVKLVIEQFSKVFIDNVTFLHQIIRSLGYELTTQMDKGTQNEDKGAGPPDALVFTNADRVAWFEESINILVRFQSR